MFTIWLIWTYANTRDPTTKIKTTDIANTSQFPVSLFVFVNVYVKNTQHEIFPSNKFHLKCEILHGYL